MSLLVSVSLKKDLPSLPLCLHQLRQLGILPLVSVLSQKLWLYNVCVWGWAGKRTQLLKALTSLAETVGSIHNDHKAAYNCPYVQFHKI